MKLVTPVKPVRRDELEAYALDWGERFVKGVVDLEKKSMLIGGELHADEEAELIGQGSNQENLWGFNIYIDRQPQDWLEFDSMINIRPSRGNRSRTVQDPAIQQQIRTLVTKLITL